MPHSHHHQKTEQTSKLLDNFCDGAAAATSLLKENDKEYYNDLPNKLPPDLLGVNGGLNEKQHQHQKHHISNQIKVSQLNLKKSRDHRLSNNLIDLNSPPPDQTTNMINLNNFETMNEGCSIGMVSTTPTSLFSATTAGVSVTATSTTTSASMATKKTVQVTPESGRPRDVFDTRIKNFIFCCKFAF